MKLLVYTFRTFPRINDLKVIFGDVFVFGKLKEDFELFKEEISKAKPDLVLGIAKADGKSRIEKFAVNKFNQKSIDKNGPESFDLFIPNLRFSANSKATTSFCNWTAYKIATQTKKKTAFIHINPNDIGNLKEMRH